VDFLEEADPDTPSEEEDNSDHGDSTDLENTSGKDDYEDSEDNSNDDENDKYHHGGSGPGYGPKNKVDKTEGGSGHQAMDENHEEFNDQDKEMDEGFGKGTYSCGLPDNEWNMW
jgi:hypothetical protein